jgi:hypothetical protein
MSEGAISWEDTDRSVGVTAVDQPFVLDATRMSAMIRARSTGSWKGKWLHAKVLDAFASASDQRSGLVVSNVWRAGLRRRKAPSMEFIGVCKCLEWSGTTNRSLSLSRCAVCGRQGWKSACTLSGCEARRRASISGGEGQNRREIG